MSLGGFYSGERGQIVLHRVVEILLARRLLFRQWLVALDVEFGPALHRCCVCERSLRLRKLTLRLIERCLKRPRIDLEKELAMPDKSPFLITLLQQVATHLRPDVRIDQPVKRANPVPINRNILFLNRSHFDIRSVWRRAHGLLRRQNASHNQSERD